MEYVRLGGYGIIKTKKDGKFGLFNVFGVNIVPHEYEIVDFFEKGLYKVKKEEKFGIIDTLNQIRVPIHYEAIGRSSKNSLIAAQLDNALGICRQKWKGSNTLYL